MKKSNFLIALAVVAALSMVACKNNNKKAQSQEPSQEEIQAKKIELADAVLAQIDSLVEQVYDSCTKTFRIKTMEFTDEEKMVKPDYLLEPSFAKNLVTRSQKIYALTIYQSEQGIRKIYNMPCDEVDEVIAKLVAEVNFPMGLDSLTSNMPLTNKVKFIYDECRKRGDQALFWQYEQAVMVETHYLLANNPELFFSKITEEQWQAFTKRMSLRRQAVEELAKYDEEVKQLWEMINTSRVTSSNEERDFKNRSIQSAKEYCIANKDKYIAKRSALLQ